MSKINLPELPSLGSCVVNEACWKFIENLPHTIPGPIFNDLKPAIYAALCHALPAYAEQAVREALAALEPVAYLNAEALDRLQKPYVAGCAAALENAPRGGFVAIAIIPNPDKDPPC
jgi:hypothetical protein